MYIQHCNHCDSQVQSSNREVNTYELTGTINYCFKFGMDSLFLKECCFMRYHFGMGGGISPPEPLRDEMYACLKPKSKYVRIGNETIHVYEINPCKDKKLTYKTSKGDITVINYVILNPMPENEYRFITQHQYILSKQQ